MVCILLCSFFTVYGLDSCSTNGGLDSDWELVTKCLSGNEHKQNAYINIHNLRLVENTSEEIIKACSVSYVDSPF